MNKFIHFRVQSSYSMLESALTIDQIVHLSKNNNMPAICLADRNNMFGSLEFSLQCSKNGIQPIHGIILNVLYEHNNFAEILLIAKDNVGYKNLLKLASIIYTKNDRKICEHITFEDLELCNEGLIVLSCYTNGIIGKLLLKNNQLQASKFAEKLQNLFKDRFYFELMRHNLESEQSIEKSYLNIAHTLGIPVIATNSVLFSDISMHEAHDVLLCISQGMTKEHQDRKMVSNQCYLKSQEEMIELFKDLPEAIENTVYLAQRCSVMAEARPTIFPKFNVPNEEQLLKEESKIGLLKRLEQKFQSENTPADQQKSITSTYFERLEYELGVICSMNFSGYFLIVSDFIKWSKEQSIAVGPGRGSVVGSIVAWALLITDLDPIQFRLFFERFLNPERISMPDIDIDFCQERREEVINYVRSKYGDTRVGQIITFGKMQAKAVIKDVSRVLGLPYKYADYLTELVPFNAVSPVTLKQAVEEVEELKYAKSGNGLYNLPENKELISQVLSTALILEGLHRHASVHAAGIVISGQDLLEVVPVYKDQSSDMLIVQYSMKYSELAGLIKFDFLGLKTLTVITKCKALVDEQNIKVDLENTNFNDKNTYEMLSKGASTGVFQFESVGMKDTLKRLKPDSIKDLIALGALYRPGPMDNIPTYIACKHERQKPDYLHPLLENILKDTYGVIIYQEQVLEIAKALAGYTLGNADLLRKAMGKKIKAEMDAQEMAFVNGAKANGIEAEEAKLIFATVAKFAGYGFNKAHSSAYGVISYYTAYLKANFTTEFLVASLNLDIDNEDKISLFIQEAKNNNINIISPDVNISSGYFSIVNKSIVYALGAIKNVTINFGQIVEEERNKNGKFTSVINFIERIPPKFVNRRLLENIIKSGCFDTLHKNRAALLRSVNKILNYSSSYHNEKNSNQYSLIAVNSASKSVIEGEVKAQDHDNVAIAFDEFEVLGLFIHNHPLSSFQNFLKKLNVKNSIDLQLLPKGSQQINIAGLIQKKDSRMSARGRFITLQLSDQFNIFEITIFSDEVLKNYSHLLDLRKIVIATCDVFKDEGGIRLTARSFTDIESSIKKAEFDIRVSAKNKEELEELIHLLNKCNNKECTNAKITLLLSTFEDFKAKVNFSNNFYLKHEDLVSLAKFEV